MISKKYRRSLTSWPIVLIILVVLALGGAGAARVLYLNSLAPVSSSTQTVYFTVQSGWSVDQIADALKNQNLIRNVTAFKSYVATQHLRGSLQAGTYILSPSLSTRQIVGKMISGDVAKNLLTILPGQRLDQIEQTFSKAGYSDSQIAAAFDPSSYTGDPALASLPAGASLEGYLYPDSFQKAADTPATTIVKESLDEMATHLTSQITQGFANHGLSTYQGVTLASIVYQETGDPNAEATVAQVFLKRLNMNIALQSNVTANYAADIAGLPRSTKIDSPYNTYLSPGLPPGPIGNMPSTALHAVAFPTNTSYLYFVADENTHKLYFSNTQDEQNTQARIHCPNTCE